MLSIRHATPGDRQAVHEWLCLSDTTSLHMGPPDFPEAPVPTREEFERDFADFYFLPAGRHQGAVMLIEDDGEPLGCLCYACFHLRPRAAELDIWLRERRLCGRGHGPAALRLLVEHLRRALSISSFLIRPSARNTRAIRAYEKAGFVLRAETIPVLRSFLREEFWDDFGGGDYGPEGTAVLTLEDAPRPQ